jgi:hypothetical protein
MVGMHTCLVSTCVGILALILLFCLFSTGDFFCICWDTLTFAWHGLSKIQDRWQCKSYTSTQVKHRQQNALNKIKVTNRFYTDSEQNTWFQQVWLRRMYLRVVFSLTKTTKTGMTSHVKAGAQNGLSVLHIFHQNILHIFTFPHC